MNTVDIIRMADKARFEIVRGDGWPDEQLIHKLERFAAFVASAEREAIAKMVEPWLLDEYVQKIRNRGQA